MELLIEELFRLNLVPKIQIEEIKSIQNLIECSVYQRVTAIIFAVSNDYDLLNEDILKIANNVYQEMKGHV